MLTELQSYLSEELDKEFLKDNIFFNKKISNLTWFGVGGSAEVLFIPQSVKHLKKVLKLIDKKTEINVIGLGSNILIRDGGLKGITIRLGKNFNFINNTLSAVSLGALVPDKVFSRYCYNKSIAGFEFLFGIPGTIGGAIAMNAGCYGSEISDVVKSYKTIDYEGNEIITKDLSEVFSYRKNKCLSNHIIVEAQVIKNNGDKNMIKEKMEYINSERIMSQPQKVRTGGSTFKNPLAKSSNKKSWQLIKPLLNEVHSPEGVCMSDKHANFIINTQTKSSNIIEDFGDSIIEKVYQKTGVLLEWEIKIIGSR